MNEKQLEKAEAEFWNKVDDFDTICYKTYKPIEVYFDSAVSFILFYLYFISNLVKRSWRIVHELTIIVKFYNCNFIR